MPPPQRRTHHVVRLGVVRVIHGVSVVVEAIVTAVQVWAVERLRVVGLLEVCIVVEVVEIVARTVDRQRLVRRLVAWVGECEHDHGEECE